MKRIVWFMKEFLYGFTITIMVLGSLVIGIYGASVAEQNTRMVGFGEEASSVVFMVDGEQHELCLFGKRWSFEVKIP